MALSTLTLTKRLLPFLCAIMFAQLSIVTATAGEQFSVADVVEQAELLERLSPEADGGTGEPSFAPLLAIAAVYFSLFQNQTAVHHSASLPVLTRQNERTALHQRAPPLPA
jgi:hypothetical protein